jgi:fluoride ion exporter CrcB/FEX
MMRTSSPPDFPQPPVDTLMPVGAQTVVTAAVAALTLIAFAAGLRELRRSGSPLFLLVLAGALVSSLNEPAGDIMIQCWHAAVGQWEAFEFLGRPIPVWVLLVYPLYFGVLPYVFYRLFTAGLTRKRFWAYAVGGFVINAAFESLLLALHVFTYYGYQPYTVAGYPVAIFIVNYTGAVLAGLVLALVGDRLKGPQQLWILIVPAAAQLTAFAALLPHVYTLNTSSTLAVKYLGATAAFAIGVAALDGIARYAEHQFAPSAPHPAAAENLPEWT